VRYFPVKLQKKYLEQIKKHPLRREIIATSVTNSILNRVGGTLFSYLQGEAAIPACDVARAYTVTREVFGLRKCWDTISEATELGPQVQKELFFEVQAIVERSSQWFLKNIPHPICVADAINMFAQGVERLSSSLEKILPEALIQIYKERFERYRQN